MQRDANKRRKTTGMLTLSLMVVLMGSGRISAQERGPLEVDVVQVAEDVYVATRPISWRFPVMGNVTIIVNEADVVVVDGGGMAQHSENVIAEIKKITNKPVSVILTTHWHGDHNVGLAVYRKHYPDVRIIAHENTRRAMVGGAMDYLNLPDDFDREESIARHRKRLEEAIEDGSSEAAIESWRTLIEDYDFIFAQYDHIGWLAADETFEDRMVLHRGDRTIEFLYLGRGNTDGDAILWLPKEKIVVTGDLVVRPTPYGFGSYPAEWAETLKGIRKLDYETLIPGHGDIQRDTAYVGNLVALMEFVAAEAATAATDGITDVDEFRKRIDWSEFDRRIAKDDPDLLYFFNMWFKQPILGSALKLANGEEVTQGE